MGAGGWLRGLPCPLPAVAWAGARSLLTVTATRHPVGSGHRAGASPREPPWAWTLPQQLTSSRDSGGNITWDAPPLGDAPRPAAYLQLLLCSGCLLADGVPHFRACNGARGNCPSSTHSPPPAMGVPVLSLPPPARGPLGWTCQCPPNSSCTEQPVLQQLNPCVLRGKLLGALQGQEPASLHGEQGRREVGSPEDAEGGHLLCPTGFPGAFSSTARPQACARGEGRAVGTGCLG